MYNNILLHIYIVYIGKTTTKLETIPPSFPRSLHAWSTRRIQPTMSTCLALVRTHPTKGQVKMSVAGVNS